jgi:predicted RNase H-like HicB family nuclease
MRYTVLLVPGEEPGIHVAHVPVLDVTTQGNSLEHAIAMAKEASELVIEDMVDRGEARPTEPAGAVIASIEVAVRVPVPV